MTEPRIVKVPVIDTGLGRSLGYESDVEFLKAAQKEREELPLAVQELLDQADRRLERLVLFGEDD